MPVTGAALRGGPRAHRGPDRPRDPREDRGLRSTWSCSSDSRPAASLARPPAAARPSPTISGATVAGRDRRPDALPRRPPPPADAGAGGDRHPLRRDRRRPGRARRRRPDVRAHRPRRPRRPARPRPAPRGAARGPRRPRAPRTADPRGLRREERPDRPRRGRRGARSRSPTGVDGVRCDEQPATMRHRLRRLHRPRRCAAADRRCSRPPTTWSRRSPAARCASCRPCAAAPSSRCSTRTRRAPGCPSRSPASG